LRAASTTKSKSMSRKTNVHTQHGKKEGKKMDAWALTGGRRVISWVSGTIPEKRKGGVKNMFGGGSAGGEGEELETFSRTGREEEPGCNGCGNDRGGLTHARQIALKTNREKKRRKDGLMRHPKKQEERKEATN